MKTNWNEITLQEFEKIHEILALKEPEAQRIVKIIAFLSGKSIEAIESMPQPVVMLLVKDISFVFTEPPTVKEKDNYVIAGKKFVFQKDMGKRSMKAYIDTLALMDNVEENLSKILATVLVPAVEKKTFWGVRLVPLPYGEVDVFEVSEFLHQNIKAVDARAIAAFFLRRSNRIMLRLIRNMKIQVRKQRIRMLIQKIKHPLTYTPGLEVLQELEKNLDVLRKSYLKCQ